ncbi:MAG: rod shape-determining protein [Candidatus Nomurabacteria bacterium]|nr:rod shape-determining protein [Candidatus Nomurabacteria bacterium]
MNFTFLKKLYDRFSNDIGIDLGTANTLVYVRGRGIVINEPSIVALNTKTGRIIAVGNEAKQMMGRTPTHLRVIRPLVDGVISDYEVSEEMLAYLINKAEKMSPKVFRPRIVVGVPSGITNVETRAVYDASRSAGAREVYIIEEPMAAAVGIRLPVHDPIGSMVVDIGGGTTDIAVISLGGVVQAKNLKIAGDKLNNDIIKYMREEFKVLVGEKTAEDIKIAVGTVEEEGDPIETTVRGRDLITGLPREVIVTDLDVRDAIGESIAGLIDGVREVLETTPPEVLSDVMRRGMFLTGGGALIRGLPDLLSSVIKIPVYIAQEPLSAVARGAGIVLEDLEKYNDVLLKNYNELPLS